MEILETLKQYKKEIIFGSLIVSAGVILDLIDFEWLNGYIKWGCLAIMCLAAYVFNEFYVKQRPKRRMGPSPVRPMQGGAPPPQQQPIHPPIQQSPPPVPRYPLPEIQDTPNAPGNITKPVGNQETK